MMSSRSIIFRHSIATERRADFDEAQHATFFTEIKQSSSHKNYFKAQVKGMISSNYFLLLISLSAAAPTLDISSEPATKQALSSIAGVLMPYYLNNNYAGLVKENESKGVDGFQW